MIVPALRRMAFAGPGVLLMVGMTSAALWSAAQIATIIAWHGTDLGRFEANPIDGRITLHDIALPFGEHSTLRIGSLTVHTGFALVTPATAAENITLQNVSIDTGNIAYRTAKIELVGSSLGQKDLAAILDKSSTTPFTTRLAKLSATAINIPEAVVERSISGQTQTLAFRDLNFRNVAAGKAATVAASGGTIQGPPPVDGTFAAISGRNFDLALLSRFFHDPSGHTDRDPMPLFAALSVDNVQFKGTNNALIRIDRIAASNVKAQLGDNAPQLLPLLGTVKFTGGSMDFPLASGRSEPLKWTLKEFSLTTDEPRDGIPTKYNLAVTDLAFLVPRDSNDTSYSNLRNLGYDALVFTVLADASWNVRTSELIVQQIALGGANIGSITLRATLGNFTKDVFSGSAGSAKFNNVTAKTMSLVVENKGLYERAVARDAKKFGKTPEEMRKLLSTSATTTVMSMLGPAPDAKSLGSAVAKFAANPGKLIVNVKSKNAAGIALSHFGDSDGARSALADKLDVTATAE